jgi:hypothetical protein
MHIWPVIYSTRYLKVEQMQLASRECDSDLVHEPINTTHSRKEIVKSNKRSTLTSYLHR